ncbi:MAG TPA: ABC transporter permease [Candidatus Binatus sp.]|uniref:ABC transporter permease n=1 Tax=Candidatus Binatus sp. TaxID=2811406 RepID=UPI002F3E638C
MTEFSLKKVWIIAKREYLERVRTRSFLLSTFVTPVLMAAFLVLPTMISTSTARGIVRDNERPARVAIASDNRALAELVSGQLMRQHGTRYEPSIVSPASPSERAQLDKKLDDSEIEGYVWIDGPAIASRRVTFTTRRMGDFILRSRLSDALSYAFAAQRMVKQGSSAVDIAAILQPVDLTAVRAGNASSAYNEVRGALVVFILMFVMLFSLLSYGVMVMRSVMEEKSSRITEVLMCAASAQELMAGKILGTGSVGLTQIGVWLSVAGYGASRSLYLRTAMTALDVGPSLIVYFVVFYTLGYLLYSAIFAGVGAIFNSIDEAQQWNFVVILPLIAASALILPVATQSDSLISVAASLFPFCSPILMFERLAVHDPPLWQVALSLTLLVATIVGAMVVSARIYRTGILMYGKRPTIRELSRWLRHA